MLTLAKPEVTLLANIRATNLKDPTVNTKLTKQPTKVPARTRTHRQTDNSELHNCKSRPKFTFDPGSRTNTQAAEAGESSEQGEPTVYKSNFIFVLS